MSRRFGKFVYVLSITVLLLWLVIYVRSRYRADLITMVTGSHHCLVLSIDYEEIHLFDISGWTGPARFQWSSGKADFDIFRDNNVDSLVGPEIPWNDIYVPPTLRWAWGKFLIQSECVYLDSETDTLTIDHLWRAGWPYSSGIYSFGKSRLNQAAAPLWSFSILPLSILSVQVASRLRRRWLKARLTGCFCSHCGYDLRATPLRCPECGVAAAARRNWRAPSTE